MGSPFFPTPQYPPTVAAPRAAAPAAARPAVAAMGDADKVGEALRRSLPLLPAETRGQLAQMLEPEALAVLTGTLVVWAGSHFFGVGEIVDLILLVVGIGFLGLAAVDAAQSLFDFATTALRAQTDADLDRAARSFAHAVALIGINAVLALLFRRNLKAVEGRGATAGLAELKPGLKSVGPPPKVNGAQPFWPKVKFVKDPALPAGEGFTSAYGDITVSSRGSATEQALVRFHEMVHSFLSPKFGPLREFRAGLRISAYLRSALLRYLEEAMAETYAQLRVNGVTALPTGIKFPVANGYVTVTQLATEGAALGSIAVGTQQFVVRFIPAEPGPPEAQDAETPAAAGRQP